MSFRHLSEKCFERVVFMGASRVGKTALIKRLMYNTFLSHYQETVEDLYRKTYLGRSYELLDTSGTAEFPIMIQHAITTGDIFVLVFSLDDPSSFDYLESLFKLIRGIRGTDVKVVIIRNKTDMLLSSDDTDMASSCKRLSLSPNEADLRLSSKVNVTSPRKASPGSTSKANVSQPHKSELRSPSKANVTSPHKVDLTSPRKADLTSQQNADLTSPHVRDLISPHEADARSPSKANVTSPHKVDLTSPQKADLTPPHKADPTSPHKVISTSSVQRSLPDIESLVITEWRCRYYQCSAKDGGSVNDLEERILSSKKGSPVPKRLAKAFSWLTK